MQLQVYLDKVRRGHHKVDFFDIRVEYARSSQIQFTTGDATGCYERPSLGAFIRVFNRGRWFFLSTTKVESLDTELARLIESSHTFPPGDDKFQTPQKYPCFELPEEKGFYHVSLSSKKVLVENYLRKLSAIPNMKTSQLTYTDLSKKKAYISSSGTEFEYEFTQGGIEFTAMLVEGEARFEDTHSIYAKSFDGLLNRENEILEYFGEAQKFIHAPTVNAGKMAVVMSPEVTGVFTHESFGHKSEADFLLGDLDSIKEWEIGKKVASDNLSIVDCGSYQETSGYCPVDDEGTPAQKTYLIKNGRLAGRLHSQQTAQVMDEAPTGNARAINFEFEPIVRMTTTYIEGGNLTFEELLKKCSSGVYVDGVKHGSGGSTFTIAPRRAYKIENGKLGAPVRVSVISGSLFKTLDCIAGISKDFRYWSGAFGGCGKLEQWPLPVAEGGPAVLVSEMQVS